MNNAMILAVKCAPQAEIFSDICKAKISAVELYLTGALLNKVSDIIKLCKNFPLKYALHASNDGGGIEELAELSKKLSAEVVVFHDNYWEDEWDEIIRQFKGSKARLCIENIADVHSPMKFIRRYGMGRCLDIEHLQMQGAGIFEEEYIKLIRDAAHIHLTGYRFGSTLWHTHIHHSPEHGFYLLDLLKKAGYSGFVVSEARISLQSYSEFRKLYDFYQKWHSQNES